MSIEQVISISQLRYTVIQSTEYHLHVYNFPEEMPSIIIIHAELLVVYTQQVQLYTEANKP